MEKKVLKVLIMITVLVIAVSTVVQANSFTASMTPSSTTVAPATEFTVTVKISNLDVGSNGINTLSGFLKYDDKVFEVINDSNIEGVNSWKPTYSSDNGKITLIKTQFVKTEEEVFQITFKTKDEASIKKNSVQGAITFSRIMGSNSQDEIDASDISTTITVSKTPENSVSNGTLLIGNNTTKNTVIKNATLSNKTVNTTENKTSNTSNGIVNGTVSGSNKNTIKNTTKYNTVDESDIPYTGVEDTIVYVLFAAIVLSLVFYVKFEKINKDFK